MTKKPNAKVLIVDDNKTVRTLLSINLKQNEYRVIEAENGAEGLLLVNKEKPDIVISDILMPQMDGFEFCKKVRATSVIPMVPFIFLTSLDQVATELRGFRTGADDYLVKSNIKKEELLNKIETMLAKSSEYKKIEESIQEGLSGNLKDLSFVELLQILHMNKKSGMLTVSLGGANAVIYLTRGNITHAEYKNWVGEEAVYNLDEPEDGTFNFENGEVAVIPTVETSTINVIMEYCRLIDEKNQ